MVIRRPLEASSRTLPFIAVMFVPILFGMNQLYIWSNEHIVRADPLLQHKEPYLNVPFFTLRAAIYFVAWIGAALLLNRWTREYETSGSRAAALRLRYVSGFGLLVVALTVTFSAIDWAMSLDPHWYSTMYGLSFMVGHVLSAMAFSVLVITSLSATSPLSDVVQPQTLRDLGNLTFAFIMLWAYLSFSQFLLIWYANLREEVTWYLPRMHGGWGWVSAALILFHFFVPFFLLLARRVKDHARSLRIVSGLIVFMHLVDLLWIVIPSVHGASAHGGEHAVNALHWIDVLAAVGLIALWVALFISRLRTRTLLPMNEPYVQEALSHG